ncbi:MAG TPA: membrane protein insertion efficiency factor YidD [Myxococcota bacterium]|nr:membrane protein insertion efficiency factor YidD [Myxococcota bacterium]
MILALVALSLASPDPEAMLRPDWEVAETYPQATLHLAYGIWRVLISPGDGGRCPMRPTCSRYAREAFARDGLGGYVLTFDRLLRDGNPTAYPPSADGFHGLDPVSAHVPPGRLLLGGHCRDQRRDGAELCL